MRLAIQSAAAATFVLAAELALAGNAPMTREPTRIPAEPLGLALQTLAKQRGFQVVYVSGDVDHQRTLGASGNLTIDEALTQLLRGTALRFHRLSRNGVIIAPARRHSAEALADSPKPTPPPEDSDPPESVALSDAEQPQTQHRLQTIIVTAEKSRYGESVLQTPVPITVLNAGQLAETGQNSIQDYYTSVPGLNLTMGGNTGGVSLVTIRGITTNLYTNPTVTSSIDDVPLGSSTLLGGGELVPDLDPSDIARVEVLRGPQGTLYGSNSMGGLIRYITSEPSTHGFDAFAQGGLTAVDHGSQVGYAERASANIPISDTIALRVSGFERRDPGYVENVQSGVKGINSANAVGGLFSALWQPSSVFTLDVNALLQTYHGDGSPQVDPTLGSLKQSLLPTTGSDILKDEVYWATGTLSLAGTQLKSITSYGSYDYSDRLDYDLLGFGPLTQGQFNVSGTLAEDDIHTDRFTQELRLYVPLGKRVEWLFGGFYDRERSYNQTGLYAVNPNTLAAAGYWGLVNEPELYEEYSGFTNLTYHFDTRFDIQLGARESHIRQSEATVSSDYWVSVLGFPTYAAISPATENAFTYLVTPRFKVSPNLMAYARFASGFRPGALNGVSPYYPVQSSPDKTENYELGLKGDFLDHKITIDTSLYYISWKNIQIEVYSPAAFSYYETNESAAKSEGVEFSAAWNPAAGMYFSGWMTWDEAVMTRAFPPSGTVYGAPGNRLPFSARVSGHVSFDQRFPIAADATGDAGIEESYIGNRIGDFTGSSVRQFLPGYAQMNLHTSVSYRSWTGEIYINNVMDKRGLLYGGLGSNYPAYFNYITPLTVGITVGKTFR